MHTNYPSRVIHSRQHPPLPARPEMLHSSHKESIAIATDTWTHTDRQAHNIEYIVLNTIIQYWWLLVIIGDYWYTKLASIEHVQGESGPLTNQWSVTNHLITFHCVKSNYILPAWSPWLIKYHCMYTQSE